MPNRSDTAKRALLAAALLWVPVAGAASASDTGSHDIPTSVEPPRHPTQVSIGAYLIGLSRVSDPSSAFPTLDVEVFLDLSWNDPRLAFESDRARVFQGEEADEELSEIWSPDPEIENEVEQRETESVELRISPDGTVHYEERFGATLNAELDLGRFPFDSQTFDVEIQSFLWDREDCVFVAEPEPAGFDPDFETPEWSVMRTETLLEERVEIRDDRAFSTYVLRIHARRNPGHYVLRFMLPLLFVMALTWAALWMPVEARIRVGFIALLTVVASHTVIAGQLPRLHYPTFADLLLMVCYLYASALIGVGILVQRFEDAEEGERAARLDRRARWMLPLLAVLCVGAATSLLWS